MHEEFAIFINGTYIGTVKSGGYGNAAVEAFQTLWNKSETIITLDLYPKYPSRAVRYEHPTFSSGLIHGKGYDLEYMGRKI